MTTLRSKIMAEHSCGSAAPQARLLQAKARRVSSSNQSRMARVLQGLCITVSLLQRNCSRSSGTAAASYVSLIQAQQSLADSYINRGIEERAEQTRAACNNIGHLETGKAAPWPPYRCSSSGAIPPACTSCCQKPAKATKGRACEGSMGHALSVIFGKAGFRCSCL